MLKAFTVPNVFLKKTTSCFQKIASLPVVELVIGKKFNCKNLYVCSSANKQNCLNFKYCLSE